MKGEGDLLARPVDYAWVWDDTSTGGTHDAAVWAPVAPPGYTCLGNVFSQGYGKPSTDLIRCIKSAYVVPARADWVWDDTGCGADDDLTLFAVRASDPRGLDASTCVGQGWYGGNGGATWTINKDMVARIDPSFGQVDAAKAARYAPRVWLAAGERFLPSSVDAFLPNVHKDSGDGVVRYTTNQDLGCDSCSDPPFLSGQRPDQVSVPVYAQIVNRTTNGQPSNTTDVIYWTFYPYNDGKDVCIGLWGGSLGCVGGYESFGNHVGDWEHVMIRFVNGNPTQVFLSAHDGGAPFNYGDPALTLVDGHPVVFAALGSHGLYPDARRHTYATLPNSFTLDDDTSFGIAWDTWNNVVTFGVQSVGSYTGSLAWLNFTGDWGNAKGGCGIYEKVGGFCIREGGPSALVPRSLANPAIWTME
ncbi:MAG: Vps62-related protein [Minicystis sp.]